MSAFGADGFGEVAFSESVDAPLDSGEFEAFLALATGRRCWLRFAM